MAEQQKQVIDFVTHIPKTVNPYTATAQLVGTLLNPHSPPRWSFCLMCITLAGFTILVIQSGFLIFQRVKAKKFGVLKTNEVGLLVIPLPDAVGTLVFAYAAMTMAFISLQFAVQYGLLDQSSLLLVFGIKFMLVLSCSWAFVWVCCCHCAMIIWKSDWATKTNRGILKAALRWGITSFFLVAQIVPYSFVIYFYTSAYQQFCAMRSIVRQIQFALLAAASDYDPQTDSRLQVLKLLMPAGKIIFYFTRMEHNLLQGIKVYCLCLTFLSIIYMPMLFFSWSDLYKYSGSRKDHLTSLESANEKWNPKNSCSKAVRDRRTSVYHSIAVYSSTLVHLPFIYWQIFHASSGFSINPTWTAITYHGLSGPFTITGNVVLLILNLHTRQVLLDMKNRLQTDSDLWSYTDSTSKREAVVFSRCVEKQVDVDLQLDLITGQKREQSNSKSLNITGSPNSSGPDTWCGAFDTYGQAETTNSSMPTTEAIVV